MPAAKNNLCGQSSPYLATHFARSDNGLAPQSVQIDNH